MRRVSKSVDTYRGELFYVEEEETIEISRFIVRKKQIAFDLTTEWGLGERWTYSGAAKRQKKGLYLAANLTGKRVVGHSKADESIPCNVIFKIEAQSDRQIQVSGTWSERGDVHAFGGKLKRFSPTKQLIGKIRD